MKLRKQRRIYYSHSHKYEGEFANLMHHTLTQYTLKVGLRRYKERGKKGVATKMQKIYDKLAFKPVKNKLLTTEQRANTLRAIMFLKEKRTGQIKGRMCADGRKQHTKSKKKARHPQQQQPNQY